MERIFDKEGIGMLIEWMLSKIRAIISSDLGTKQDKLVSGENIKTINGTSLLGSGNFSISGGSGGDFNDSGTYPNLTAGKATKLATARTISLSGGASGSVSFDGSANESLDVTGLKEAYLTAGGRNITYGYSMLDGMATVEGWNNRLSYWNTDYITVEYTNNYTENEDGTESAETIWTDYFEGKTSDERKRVLTTIVTNGLTGYALELTGAYATPCVAEQSRLRVTIDAYSGRYFVGKKILTRLSRGSTPYNDQLVVEKVTRKDYNNGNTEKWVKVTQSQVAGDSGWNSLDTPLSNFGISQYAATRRLRLTYIAKTSREHGFAISQIRLIGDNVFDIEDNLAERGGMYSWDIDKNVTFPAAIKGTKHVTIGGTAEQLVLGNGGLKSIKDITDSFSYSVDNLVSKLVKGGNTTVNGNVVTTNGENRDTFFYIGTSEPIDTNIPYTLGFYVEGVEEGEQWRFNVGGILIECVNGYCWATGYFNSTLEGKTSILCDDNIRGGDYIITISQITLRKGTLRGYGTNAYIKKQGTSEQVLLGDGSLKALSEIGKSYSVVTTSADGLMSKGMYAALKDGFITNIVNVTTNESNVELSYNAAYPNADGTFNIAEGEGVEIPLATPTTAGVMSAADKSKLDLFTHTKEDYGGNITERLVWNITENPEADSYNAYEQRIEKNGNYIVTHFEVINFYGNISYNNFIELGDPDNYVAVSPTSIEGYFPNDRYFILDRNGCEAEQFVKHNGTSTQILMADGSVKEISDIGGEDSRYSHFIDALNDSNSAPIIPSEAFFSNAAWVDIPEDNEATLDFMNEDAKTLFYDGEKWVEEGMAAAALHIPYANNATSGLMSAKDKIKLDGFDGFDTGKDYVGADVANGDYGRNNYIDLSGKGLNVGDIIIVTHKNGNYVAYAMLIWADGGMFEIKNESTPATTISTQYPYIVFSSVQETDEITIRKIHTTRL